MPLLRSTEVAGADRYCNIEAMKKSIICVFFQFFCFMYAEYSYSQLIVIDTFNNTNINALAQNLVGAGVSIFNVQYQCDDGGLGIFNGLNSKSPPF